MQSSVIQIIIGESEWAKHTSAKTGRTVAHPAGTTSLLSFDPSSSGKCEGGDELDIGFSIPTAKGNHRSKFNANITFI